MNGQLIAKLENLERELKEIKTLLKKEARKPKKKARLTLSEIAKRLQVVGKEISPKELEEEIRAVRARE